MKLYRINMAIMIRINLDKVLLLIINLLRVIMWVIQSEVSTTFITHSLKIALFIATIINE
jgi:hypothetical protein